MTDEIRTARIHIFLKRGVVDPQGKAIHQALHSLGFDGVTDVRVGKQIEVDLAGRTLEETTRDLSAMCERLLANPLIEDYRIDLSACPAQAGMATSPCAAADDGKEQA